MCLQWLLKCKKVNIDLGKNCHYEWFDEVTLMQFHLNELKRQKALATDLSNFQKTMGLHSWEGIHP